ncbi:MAG: 50S ribosomal protein L15e [Candidatus Aenigmarchaeota archaeon]|nr:50S ribosomal protein L15e [Candidatus Aenigmarchaeota archaeon]
MLAKYMRKSWKESIGDKSRLAALRGQSTVERVERPSRIGRAHSLGYKAKQGFVVLDVKVKKGKRKRPKVHGGRKPSKAGRFFSLGKSGQVVAEEKAARHYHNLEVLGSYFIAEDGVSKWFEVVMVDKHHPSIRSDSDISWILERQHRGRAFRGLTPAGKRGRGLLGRGRGSEKVRPSYSASFRKKGK